MTGDVQADRTSAKRGESLQPPRADHEKSRLGVIRVRNGPGRSWACSRWITTASDLWRAWVTAFFTTIAGVSGVCGGKSVALPAPTERERTQWYFQRYVEHLPAAGEISLFDRSWYNRAGVEHVMGFCTEQEYRLFLRQCPIFEQLLIESGIILRKYWFSVSDAEQERRFRDRLADPMRQWKLSPMDLESITRWEDYSRAKDEMFHYTDIPEAPWYVVESEDKRRARINMIAHLLSTIPYHEVHRPPLRLPRRPASKGYERPPRDTQTYVPDHSATLGKHS